MTPRFLKGVKKKITKNFEEITSIHNQISIQNYANASSIHYTLPNSKGEAKEKKGQRYKSCSTQSERK